MRKVIPFYTKTLRFDIEYHQGDSYISFIFNNDSRLGIKVKEKEREIPGKQTVIIEVKYIKKDYDRLKKKSIPFYKELQIESWGITFSILDPDGNKIEFVQKK
jgi:predicted enzyme related to lactoylglutathione lyase